MKKMLALVLVGILLLGTIGPLAGAEGLTEVLEPVYEDNGEGLTLVRYPVKEQEEAVVLPEAVTAISEGAFAQCNVTSVDLSQTKVEELPDRVFAQCTELTSVKLPASTYFVSQQAFVGCTALALVEIPGESYANLDEVFSHLEGVQFSIGESHGSYVTGSGGNVLYRKNGSNQPDQVIYASNRLTSLTIPDTVTALGKQSFSRCNKLHTLVLPASVTTIAADAFLSPADGSSLRRINPAITVSENNPQFFSYNRSLYDKKTNTLLLAYNSTLLDIPEGVTAVGRGAAQGCSLIQKAVLPVSLQEIGENAFRSCSKLATVSSSYQTSSNARSLQATAFASAPGGVMANSFKDCAKLSQVELSPGLPSIQGNAFADCPGLKSIYIPSTVKAISANAFPSQQSIRIVGEPGSAAEKFVEDNPQGNFTFDTSLEPPTPSPTPSAPAASPSSSPSSSPKPSTSPSASASPTPSPSPSPSAAPTPLPSPTARPSPSPSPVPTATPSPTPSASPSVTPSISPSPQPTPPGVSEEEIADTVWQFPDIAGHWAKVPIAWVVKTGLYQGIGPNTFSPNNAMERGMLVTVLYRFAGKPDVDGTSGFSDVPPTAYYADPVTWASRLGIVTGTGQNQFRPKDKISREQLAVVLFRYQSLQEDPPTNGSLSAFRDADKISSWAKPALQWALSQGILTGRPNNLLDPKGPATRAEVSMVMLRFARVRFQRDYPK